MRRRAAAGRQGTMRAGALMLGTLALWLTSGWLAPGARAQFAMPDPKQMAGIPRPVTDLPDGTVSVRLIRGQLSNNLPNHAVELEGAGTALKRVTDENGRAEFKGVAPGTTVKAVADVDGEHLESQEFPFPGQGGIRLLLVATEKAGAAGATASPAVGGQVVIGPQSRIVLEPVDEAVTMYYLLDIQNDGPAPVTPPPFQFDTPAGAIGATLLEGSAPQASVVGTHVLVQGPFPPGHTFVQVACQLPYTGASLQITQRFPATVEALAVVAKKIGTMRLSSAAITDEREVTEQGETYITAGGRSLPADQPLVLQLDDLPHHSAAPRWITLSVAGAILLVGVWSMERGGRDRDRAAERAQLLARREKLFRDLVKLETDQGRGRAEPRRYASRREELVRQLEHVYGALDTDDNPGPADRAGVAA